MFGLSGIFEANLIRGLLLLTAGLAWLWGAGPERACASTLLYVWLGDRVYHAVFGHGAILNTVDLGHAFLDLSSAVVLTYVALRANRLYPICIAALQIMTAISHLTRELSTAIAGKAYAILIMMPSVLEIVILLSGVILHCSRVKKHGKYPSWLSTSPPLPGSARGM